MGRTLVVAGLVVAALGLVVLAFERLNVPFGRLPGDIVWRGKNTTVYFPWVTCVLLSILGSVLLWLLSRRS